MELKHTNITPPQHSVQAVCEYSVKLHVCVCVCAFVCMCWWCYAVHSTYPSHVLFTCCTVWGSDGGACAGIICCVCCTQLLFCLDCILFGLERETWAPGWACGIRRRTFPTAFVRPSRKTCSYIYIYIYAFWNDSKKLKLHLDYIKGTLCYHSFQNPLSSCMLSNNIKIKINQN